MVSSKVVYVSILISFSFFIGAFKALLVDCFPLENIVLFDICIENLNNLVQNASSFFVDATLISQLFVIANTRWITCIDVEINVFLIWLVHPVCDGLLA